MKKNVKLDNTDTKIMMKYLNDITNEYYRIINEISENGICECDLEDTFGKPMEHLIDELRKEKPYINGDYNPDYGDDRICVCGHSYERHFDPYEYMDAVGCKYCSCDKFVEKTDI